MPLGAARISLFSRPQVTAQAEVIRKKLGFNTVGSTKKSSGSVKFGTTSVRFINSGDSLRGDGDLTVFATDGDFTYEAWVYFTSDPGSNMNFFDCRDGAVNSNSINFFAKNNQISFFQGARTDYGGSLTTDQWYHVALTRSGSDYTAFLDGTKLGTASYSDGNLYIAIIEMGTGLIGYMDEIRISNTVRYTGDFTPQTEPFVNDANTLMLVHGDGTQDATSNFVDDNGVRPKRSMNNVDIPFGVNVPDGKFGFTSAGFGGNIFEGSANDESSNPYAVGLGEFTIEGWVNPDSVTSNVPLSFRTPSSDTSGSRAEGLVLRIENGVLWFSNASSWVKGNGNTTISTGSWHHIAVSRDSGGTVRLFVDGNQEKSIDGSTWDFGNTNRPGYIGNIYPGGSYAYDGNIDEVRFSTVGRYTSGFTPQSKPFVNDKDTALLMHMEAFVTDPGNIGFDDDNGVRDKVALKGLGNFKLDTSNKKFGVSSGLYDGDTDYIIVNASQIPIPHNENAFTCEAWIYGDSQTGGAIITASLNNGTVPFTLGTTLAGENASPNADAKRPFFGFYNGSWNTVASDTDISFNQWIHVAGVYDGSTAYIFVDGNLRGSITTSWTSTAPNDVYIGRRWDEAGTGGENWFKGNIDEVRISSTARYTSAFTPQTTPFQNDENTVLLMHNDGVDQSIVLDDDNGVNPKYSY